MSHLSFQVGAGMGVLPRAVEGSEGPRGGASPCWFPPLPVPVGQSQGLRVGGGDHEADGWSGQLVSRAVSEVPALPVVPLQGVAVAP